MWLQLGQHEETLSDAVLLRGIKDWAEKWRTGSWLGNRYQSLPKTFCKSVLKMLCYKWKAQQSSLTASTAPLEEECDRSDEKQVLHICGHTPYPMWACSKFLYSLPVTNGVDPSALTALKHMESNILFWLAHPCLTGCAALLPRKPDWHLMIWGPRLKRQRGILAQNF